MSHTHSDLLVKDRRFKRAMLSWGLPLLLAEIALLGFIGNRVPIPDHISATTLFSGFFLFVLAGCIIYVPLWSLSHHLHKRFGLICPKCGRWFSPRSGCKHCQKGGANAA
jgi:hypothetical protein